MVSQKGTQRVGGGARMDYLSVVETARWAGYLKETFQRNVSTSGGTVGICPGPAEILDPHHPISDGPEAAPRPWSAAALPPVS